MIPFVEQERKKNSVRKKRLSHYKESALLIAEFYL